MAVQNVATTAIVGVWDTSANAWKTGDAANLTLKITADGVAGALAASPAEIDATNQPGRYSVAVAADENTGVSMEVSGVSATANCIVIPDKWENLDATIGSREASGAAVAAVGGLNDFDPATEQVLLAADQDVRNVSGNVAGSVASVSGAVGSVTNPVTLTSAYDAAKTAAQPSDIAAITQAQRVRIVAPAAMERPDADSTTYRIYIYAYDAQHVAEDLDDLPVVAAQNNVGTDRSANLGSVVKPADTTGVYYVDYTVASDHAIEGLLLQVDATEGAVTTQYATAMLVVDTTAVDFTSADRTKLEVIYGKLPAGNLGDATAAAIAALNNLSQAQAQAAATAALNTYDPPTAAELTGATSPLATAANLALVKTVTDVLAAMISGGAWTEAAMVNAAGASAQEVIDGFNALTPAGASQSGSFGEQFDVIQAAAEAASGAVGTGSKSVIIQVNDGDGNAVPNVQVTVKNAAQTANIGIQNTNSTGATPQGFGLDPATAYKIVLSGLDANYTFSNPYSVTTAAGTGAQTLTLTCTVTALPAPAAAGYCAVVARAIPRQSDADTPTGTFRLVKGTPRTLESGSRVLAITDGDDAKDLDASGEATLNILQASTVTLRLEADNKVWERQVLVPSNTGPVDFLDLAEV